MALPHLLLHHHHHLLLLLLLLGHLSLLLSLEQPQNIETFYPLSILSPPPPPHVPSHSPNSTTPINPYSHPPPPPPLSSTAPPSIRNEVVKAVAATAASTLFVSFIVFFVARRYRKRKEAAKDGEGKSPNGDDGFGGVDRLVVDERGLDVVYWRQLEEGEHVHKVEAIDKPDFQKPSSFEFIVMVPDTISQEITVVDSSELEAESRNSSLAVGNSIELRSTLTSNGEPSPPVPSPNSSISSTSIFAPAPPPPPPPAWNIRTNSSSASGPPPPPPPLMKSAAGSKRKAGADEKEEGQATKLKPLHWEKVSADADHSMVWDKVSGGSFRCDYDLMEALFGTVAANRKKEEDSASFNANPAQRASAASQTVLLDPRKSQNTAIVLKSLGMSTEKMIDFLHHPSAAPPLDTLEKLAKIAPSHEEQEMLKAFLSNMVSELAEPDAFLHRLLTEIPTAFQRIDALVFHPNYDLEMENLTLNLKTLDEACKELKKGGLFLKLLEAILKAGNRMNAGTARGNAQAFNLSSLRRLSDVKSMDGSTTLLHFVVQEVIRSEGRRCVINQELSLRRADSSKRVVPVSASGDEDKEREYLMLGLPLVGGLSEELSNVRAAAGIDYDSMVACVPSLTKRVSEIRAFVRELERGEFRDEMMIFVEKAEAELRNAAEEVVRVLDLVKRTTEYYHAGAAKENKLELFVIVKDFLGMVDKACVEIARTLQRGRSMSPRTPARLTARFPNLAADFVTASNSDDKS